MYHRVRRKMKFEISAILFLSSLSLVVSKAFDVKKLNEDVGDDIENDIIDFDDEYSVKYDKKYEVLPWDSNNFQKDTYKYTVVNDKKQDENPAVKLKVGTNDTTSVLPITEIIEKTTELSVIPLELISTTESILISAVDTTTELDLTVIPLSTSEKIPSSDKESTSDKTPVEIIINQTVTLPVSTESSEDYNLTTVFYEMTTKPNVYLNETTTESIVNETTAATSPSNLNETSELVTATTDINVAENFTESWSSTTPAHEIISTTVSKVNETINRGDYDSTEVNVEVPIFTELDTEDISEVPEDYYDSKDIVTTSAPKTDALSVLFGFAGSVVESVVESVAERVVPKGLYDLFKRMQKQNEALEAEKLRSREENGGIGQFTRGVIKTISSGLSRPLSQLMAGVRDIGSLDSDRGFINSLASGVTSVADVANSMVDVFKDRVQAIYPGTIWCGDGHSAQARSGDLGLFFFTDTCCRQHDACKLYITAGETKFGLTNAGLFTRSHCSCDAKFRACLRKTNSLVSAQIGLTYFNVLGPQCFRRAHPIVKCVRRTRITGLKCEEYELDYTKPKMWQWFDNETF